jgi:hypothetical protein
MGKNGGSDLTNVQHKPIWNTCNKSLLYNEYILVKKLMEKNPAVAVSKAYFLSCVSFFPIPLFHG